MRPQRQHIFRMDAASRLDDIELVAALLVRDASNSRAISAERGATLLPMRPRRRLRFDKCGGLALRASRLARRCASRIIDLARHPRLRAAAWEAWSFIVDVTILLSAALAAAVIVTAAVLIGASPA